MKRRFTEFHSIEDDRQVKKRRICNPMDIIREILEKQENTITIINNRLSNIENRLDMIEQKIKECEIPTFKEPASYIY